MDEIIAVSKEPYLDGEAVKLRQDPERCILCRACLETIEEQYKEEGQILNRGFLVQQAETVISLVNENNGLGIISELVVNNYQNALYRRWTEPRIELEIGVLALDLHDLAPAAAALYAMIREECEEYRRMQSIIRRIKNFRSADTNGQHSDDKNHYFMSISTD